jgi:hypothetical protein
MTEPRTEAGRALSERTLRTGSLRSLLRHHEPTKTPYRRITADMERELLSWAATLPDETILEMRDTGPVKLRWIREHEPEDNGWQERGQPDDDYAIWSGSTTFAMVLQKTGWRAELFWNGSGGWFTARLISPWDRDGNAAYPGGFLAPFDNPLGASGATPEEAFAHLAEAVLEWVS